MLVQDRGYRFDHMSNERKDALHSFLALPVTTELAPGLEPEPSATKDNGAEDTSAQLNARGRRIGHNVRMTLLKK